MAVVALVLLSLTSSGIFTFFFIRVQKSYITVVPYLALDHGGDVPELVVAGGDLLAPLQEHGNVGLGRHQELPPDACLGLGGRGVEDKRGGCEREGEDRQEGRVREGGGGQTREEGEGGREWRTRGEDARGKGCTDKRGG